MGWRDGLNESQLQAAQQIDGQVLILAGAGSGKTKTLTHRICHMIEEGIPASQILAITFTNRAAKEMTKRVADLLDGMGENSKPKTCTFHSLGFEIVREHGCLIGYRPHIGICDEDDRKKRLKQALEKVEKANEYDEGFLTKRKGTVESISKFISKMKDLCLLPDECKNVYKLDDDVMDMDDLIMGYSIYQGSLMEDNQVDFDDLISASVRLLEKEEVAKTYWRKFKYISVDEYQDTSKAQFRMVHRLVEGNGNICVVGDDYQSIYAFRGADISNILSFQKVYPNAKVVVLGENYRSTPQIVNGASSVISLNPNQMHKELFSMNPDGKPITVASFSYYTAEADYVAKKIKNGLDKGKEAGEYAVLYRNNDSSRFIEDALLAYNIPYVIYGGVSFYARKEIKDIVAYIRLAAGFDDTVALGRVANVPKRGLGKKALLSLEEGIKREKGTLLQKLHDYSLTIPGKKGIDELDSTLSKYRTYIVNCDLPKAIKMIIDDLDYFEYLKAEYANKDNDECESRINNVKELISKAKEFYDGYIDEHPEADTEEVVESFLENIVLMTDADRNKDDGKSVKLMTMHSSKGLEFGTVFVVACEERRSFKFAEELYEERRLFYVAMTRAKKKLFISHSKERVVYGKWTFMSELPFIREIPKEYCKLVSDCEPTARLSRSSVWYSYC